MSVNGRKTGWMLGSRCLWKKRLTPGGLVEARHAVYDDPFVYPSRRPPPTTIRQAGEPVPGVVRPLPRHGLRPQEGAVEVPPDTRQAPPSGGKATAGFRSLPSGERSFVPSVSFRIFRNRHTTEGPVQLWSRFLHIPCMYYGCERRVFRNNAARGGGGDYTY